MALACFDAVERNRNAHPSVSFFVVIIVIAGKHHEI